jgi:fructosamine-3-kinase
MSALYIKRNQSRYPDHLLREAYGLEALRRAAAGTDIDVPRVIHVDQQALTMPLIRSVQCSSAQWTKLGRGLALIHSRQQQGFGFEEDNYIGLNRQLNTFSDSWGEFFVEQRLGFQISLIENQERRRRFSECLRQQTVPIRQFLDSAQVAPSLLHGDLWRGNVLCGESDHVWLIDPAVYYGDADADLAMTQLFGGFPAQFYSAYRSMRPEPSNWPLKMRIYNLYHYLNHLNLFGDAYLDNCEAGFAMLAEL